MKIIHYLLLCTFVLPVLGCALGVRPEPDEAQKEKVESIVIEPETVPLHEIQLAQSKSRGTLYAFSYSTRIPHQYVGIGFAIIRPNNVGLYIDVKTDLGAPVETWDDFISRNQAENIWGDKVVNRAESLGSASIGLTLSIARSAALYGAYGRSATSKYIQYYDRFEIIGEHGKYWLREKTETGNNFLGGILFLSYPFCIQIGAESNPFGVTAGMGIAGPGGSW